MAVSCEGSWLSTVQGRSGSTTLTSLHLCYRWLRRSGKAVAEGSVKGSANSSTNSVQQSSNVLVCLQHDVLQAIIAFSRDVAGLPKQSCQFFIFCHILLLTAVEACNSHLNLPLDVEAIVVNTVASPVNPVIFRLLRVGKLVRALRMVTVTSSLAVPKVADFE